MSHTFIDYPSSGPDQGIIQDLSPAAVTGTSADALTGSLKRLYQRYVHNMPISGMWIDDPSISSTLFNYLDADDLGSSMGATNFTWPDRTGKADWTIQQVNSSPKPIVVLGRNGLPCVRFPATSLTNSDNGNTYMTMVGPRAQSDLSTGGMTLFFVFDAVQRGIAGNVVLFNGARPDTSTYFQLASAGGGCPPLLAGIGGTPSLFAETPASLLQDGPNALAIQLNGSAANYWLNGSNLGSLATPFNGITLSLSQLGLGFTAQSPGNNDFTSGPVGNSMATDYFAVAVYNSALTTDQINALNASLVAKYVPHPANNNIPKVIDSLNDLIVFDGDSRAWGFGPRFVSGDLAHQLLHRLAIPNMQVANVAIPGISSGGGVNSSVVTKYYSAARSNNVAVLDVGINDLEFNTSNATTVYNNIVTWATAVKSAGFKAIVCTVLPQNSMSTPSLDNLDSCNSMITGDSTHFDGVADFAANTTLVVSRQIASTYTTDGLHINDAGNSICAGILKNAVLSLIA